MAHPITIDQMVSAVNWIVEEVKKKGFGKGKGGGGTLICPLCSRLISFRVAASNGHIRAICQRPNCINFIQ